MKDIQQEGYKKNLYNTIVNMFMYIENIPRENVIKLINTTFTGNSIKEAKYPESSRSEIIIMESILIELEYYHSKDSKEVIEGWESRVIEAYESVVMRGECV